MSPALPRPLNARGRVKARWVQWQARQRALLFQRGRGRCELECGALATEAHHVFGRRNQIAEPMASHVTLLAALCSDCHRRVTVEPASADASRLRTEAMGRARARFGVAADVLSPWTLEEAMRASGQWDQLLAESGREGDKG